jgi:hypothetical protein
MNHADRLELVQGTTLTGNERFQIVWRNEKRNDLYLMNFHPTVPREAALEVLLTLKNCDALLRNLR